MIFMPKQYPRELRERAVCLVIEHRGEYESEYAAIQSIAAKLGIATPETLRQWVRQAEVDAEPPSPTSEGSRAESSPSTTHRCRVGLDSSTPSRGEVAV
jgi:transposase